MNANPTSLDPGRVQDVDVSADPEERIRLYRQAERLAIEEGARVPIYFVRDAVLVSPRVRGLRTNLMGSLPHHQVSLSELPSDPRR